MYIYKFIIYVTREKLVDFVETQLLRAHGIIRYLFLANGRVKKCNEGSRYVFNKKLFAQLLKLEL